MVKVKILVDILQIKDVKVLPSAKKGSSKEISTFVTTNVLFACYLSNSSIMNRKNFIKSTIFGAAGAAVGSKLSAEKSEH